MLEIKQKIKLKHELQLHNFTQGIKRRCSRIVSNDCDILNMRFMNHLPSINDTQKILYEAVENKHPFLSLRFGLYEYLLCYQYLEKLCGIRKEYSDFIKYHIQMDAGINSGDEKKLDSYCHFIITHLKQVDVMSYWRNIPPIRIFERFYSTSIQHINVDYLYPYPFLHDTVLPYWQQSLYGKKVLVVSSFAETIQNQYLNRRCIWKKANADYILPEMELKTYKSIVTNGGMADDRFCNWQDAIKYMSDDILKIQFDLALISTGGYGMPLAIELNRHGRKALQWGGCFQLWFGVLGGRWCQDPKVKAFQNEYWVYPSLKETPLQFKSVNNSSYWNPKL